MAYVLIEVRENMNVMREAQRRREALFFLKREESSCKTESMRVVRKCRERSV